VGGWFLAVQLVPGLGEWIQVEVSWPLIVIGVGVLLLLFGLLAGAPDMAVPATIVAGIGGLLYWMNNTGNWASWAYAWTLIPGFVGIGVILAGLFGGRMRSALREGGGLLVISLVMFAGRMTPAYDPRLDLRFRRPDRGYGGGDFPILAGAVPVL
jgi:hypothetical protein